MLVVMLANIGCMVAFYLILRSRFSSRKILSEIRSEMDKLVSDLGREADRDVALLESRIKNLRALMDEADRRILLAGKEEGRRRNGSVVIDVPESPVSAVPPPAAQIPPGLHVGEKKATRQVESVPEERQVEARPERQSEPIRIYTRPVIRRSENPIEPVIPVRERVLDMARKGLSAELIAHTLAMPLGEIELILDMNDSSL